MTIFGRAASFVIDKLVYLLIGRKNFTFTPAPDDWPPEGSMHFLRLNEPVASNRLPPGSVQYEFAPNVGEDDPMVWELGEEILFRLCDSRPTLIVLEFDSDPPKSKRRKLAMSVAEMGTEFLCSLAPEASVTQRENLSACLTDGCPPELFSQFRASKTLPNGFIDIYLFFPKSKLHSAAEGFTLVEHAEFQMQLYFSYGPNSLNFVFDPARLDINTLNQVVQDVCDHHGILLRNPPNLSTT